jgi:hypothetical protein
LKVGDIVKPVSRDEIWRTDRVCPSLAAVSFGLIIRSLTADGLLGQRVDALKHRNDVSGIQFFDVLWMDGEIDWIHAADLEVIIEGR